MKRVCLRRAKAKCAAATRLVSLLACLSLILACLVPAGICAENGSFHWKSLDGGQVKLDDKIPLTWNIFQLEKKKQPNLILVLLGRRYLLLDSKTKLAYLVFPTDLHPQGPDLDSADLAQSSRVIPSVDWTVRDVGPAEEIRLTLEDYGRTLSVQLPHPPDIRLGIY
jgi:hypothetical protein